MRKIKRRKNKVTKVRQHLQIEKENIEKANDLGLKSRLLLESF